MLTPVDPCMIFDPIIALHIGQGFVRSNLVNIPFTAFLSSVTSGWTRLIRTWTLIPSVAYTSLLGNGSSYRLSLPQGTPEQFDPGWPWLTPAWPMIQECITLGSGILPIKSGGHRVFVKQLDLWIIFDLWWGFKNMPTNLGAGPLPLLQVSVLYLTARRNA